MSKQVEKPRKTGRPTKYRPEYAKQAYRHCLLGATGPQLAELFEVTQSTISKWIVEIPAFSEAIRQGRQDADANVAQALYHRALGYSHPAVRIVVVGGKVVKVSYTEHYPPDASSMIFWLKNRRPASWRDKPDMEGMEADEMMKELADAIRNSPHE